ncbi:hypothetical protein HDV00_006780 [Rhizophlyctis rosea]|nr:hypothetical protein HDV00_006780 [Rhizophlyctis rosea]
MALLPSLNVAPPTIAPLKNAPDMKDRSTDARCAAFDQSRPAMDNASMERLPVMWETEVAK